jgi:hypothetical protein
VIERNTSSPFLSALYAGQPAQRVALSMDLPLHVPVGSYSAAAETRPSKAQLDASCGVLRRSLGELPLKPCNSHAGEPGAFFDLDLAQLAIHPPTVVRRDGTLGPQLLRPQDVALYSPASPAQDVEAEERAAREAAVAALRAELGADAVADELPLAPPTAASGALLWRWGGGHLARVARSVRSTRVVTASAALDTPPRAAPSAGGRSAPRTLQHATSDARLPSALSAMLGGEPAVRSLPSSVLHGLLDAAATHGLPPLFSSKQAPLAKEGRFKHHFGGLHISIIPEYAPRPAAAGAADAAAPHAAAAPDAASSAGGAAGHRAAAHEVGSAVLPPLVALHVMVVETGVVEDPEAATVVVEAFGRQPAAASVGGSADSVIAAAFRGRLLAPSSGGAVAATDAQQPSFPGADAPQWRAEVSRRLDSTGLHRNLTYTIDAQTDIPAAALPPAFLAALRATRTGAWDAAPALAAFAPRCRIALAQRVEATGYFDLDEVRDSQRRSNPTLLGAGASESGSSGSGASGGGRAAGARSEAAAAGGSASSAAQRSLQLRGFARYIDVERPTSASSQHVVVLSTPVRESAVPDPSASYAYVEAVELPRTRTDAPGGVRLRVHAGFSALYHMRYQATGCGGAEAETEAGNGAAQASSQADAGAGPTAAWLESMSAVYGHALGSDGSVFLQANASDIPVPPSVAAAIAASRRFGVQWPYVEGCYALAHLPLPTVHLQCDEDAAGLLELLPSRTEVMEAAAPMPAGVLSAALATTLREEVGSAAPAGQPRERLAVDAWTSVPLVAQASSALPFYRGFSAQHFPVLAPVPVGDKDHVKFVSPVTTLAAVGCAMLLTAAAFLNPQPAVKVAAAPSSSSEAAPAGHAAGPASPERRPAAAAAAPSSSAKKRSKRAASSGAAK